MAKKAPTPTITHTEILARAIQSIDAEILDWGKRCEGLPEEYFRQCTVGLQMKRDTVCHLYYLETGNEYD